MEVAKMIAKIDHEDPQVTCTVMVSPESILHHIQQAS